MVYFTPINSRQTAFEEYPKELYLPFQRLTKMSVLVTDLRPHLALVTGASGGIGKATCRALATLGCSIAVHYHSSTEAANALVEELKGKGVRAEAFKADLTQYDEVCLSSSLRGNGTKYIYKLTPLLTTGTGSLSPRRRRLQNGKSNNTFQQCRLDAEERHQIHHRSLN